MADRERGDMIAAVVAIVLVAGLVIVFVVTRPRTTLDVDDPGGVVDEVEMVTDRSDRGPRVAPSGFRIAAAESSCQHYGGDLTAAVLADGGIELAFEVEGRGDCDDSCEFVWVTGTITDEYRDEARRLIGSNCDGPTIEEVLPSG